VRLVEEVDRKLQCGPLALCDVLSLTRGHRLPEKFGKIAYRNKIVGSRCVNLIQNGDK